MKFSSSKMTSTAVSTSLAMKFGSWSSLSTGMKSRGKWFSITCNQFLTNLSIIMSEWPKAYFIGTITCSMLPPFVGFWVVLIVTAIVKQALGYYCVQSNLLCRGPEPFLAGIPKEEDLERQFQLNTTYIRITCSSTSSSGE